MLDALMVNLRENVHFSDYLVRFFFLFGFILALGLILLKASIILTDHSFDLVGLEGILKSTVGGEGWRRSLQRQTCEYVLRNSS